MSPYGVRDVKEIKKKKGNKKKKAVKAIVKGLQKFKDYISNLDWGGWDD